MPWETSCELGSGNATALQPRGQWVSGTKSSMRGPTGPIAETFNSAALPAYRRDPLLEQFYFLEFYDILCTSLKEVPFKISAVV